MSDKDGLLTRLDRTEGTLNEIIETIQAISQVVGPNEVQDRVGAIKRDKMAAGIAEAVKNGQLEGVDTVTETSLLVGEQATSDGKVIFPGRFQLFVNILLEEVREQVLGTSVGDKVTLPDNSVVTISEIYGPPGPKKDEPKKAPKPKKAAKAPPISSIPN